MIAKVRKAVAADLPSLLGLAPSDERRRSRLESEVRAGRCFVADADSSLAGYAVLGQDFFEEGFVHLLYVDASQRRKGVATALISALEAECPAQKLFISTNRSNGPMRALLRKLGYAEVGVVDGLDEGDPEVFFLKQLKSD